MPGGRNALLSTPSGISLACLAVVLSSGRTIVTLSVRRSFLFQLSPFRWI
jgi:hypothetical protein